MNNVKKLIGRWWQPLLFFAWTWTILGLFRGKQYLSFLRPEFAIVLGLGIFTLLGFLAVGMYYLDEKKFGMDQILHVLILVLPIIYIYNAKGASLDSFAFKNRSLGMPSVAANSSGAPVNQQEPEDEINKDYEVAPSPLQRAEEKASTTPDDRALTAAENPVDNVDPAKGSELDVNILNLYESPDIYKDKHIKFVGMLMKDAKVTSQFGKNACVIFRFLINCCAADAVPLAVVVKGGEISKLEDGAWVEASGKFFINDEEDRRVPMLLAPSLKGINAPEQVYLY